MKNKIEKYLNGEIETKELLEQLDEVFSTDAEKIMHDLGFDPLREVGDMFDLELVTDRPEETIKKTVREFERVGYVKTKDDGKEIWLEPKAGDGDIDFVSIKRDSSVLPPIGSPLPKVLITVFFH